MPPSPQPKLTALALIHQLGHADKLIHARTALAETRKSLGQEVERVLPQHDPRLFEEMEEVCYLDGERSQRLNQPGASQDGSPVTGR
jgi:hypothetical protein